MTWNLDIPKAANQVLADVADINENLACLQYINVWIPAAAMIPMATSGASPGVYEYPTYNVNIPYYAFAGDAAEYVSTNVVMPENWNRSTIKAKFYWAPGDAACSAGDKVEWQLGGLAIGNDDPIDAEFTDLGEVITDTVLAGKDGDLHITGATPAITITGTPALGDLVNLFVRRNPANADDTMSEDAWLFGVYLQLGINEAISAW